MIFNIIFVRHGLSCANVLSKKRPGFQLFYQDPELTYEGIYNSKDFSEELQEFITKTFEEDTPPGEDTDYLVASSQMIRAQETAFHMLAANVNKPIYIFPHVGEKPFTYDNYSLPRDQQREIMGKRRIDAGILDKLKLSNDVWGNRKGTSNADMFHNFREEQTLYEKSNFPMFIEWLKLWSAKNFNKPLNLVIFTHGMFIRSIVKNLPHVSNNNAVYVRYDAVTDTIINKPKIHQINDRKILYECPDGCRKTRCAEKEREWGSAGRRERISILDAEKGVRKFDDLHNLQKPKTFKNYLKRGYYGIKRLFNGKRFTNRVKSAEARRNTMVSKIASARAFNRLSRKEQKELEPKAKSAKSSWFSRLFKKVKAE